MGVHHRCAVRPIRNSNDQMRRVGVPKKRESLIEGYRNRYQGQHYSSCLIIFLLAKYDALVKRVYQSNEYNLSSAN